MRSIGSRMHDALGFARRTLWTIFAVSIAGTAFSGMLTWREFAGAASSCSALGSPGGILGYPPCVYGLVMYVSLAAVSGWAAHRLSRVASTAMEMSAVEAQ